MAQPTPYNRLYNFTDFQTVNPTTPLPATQVDNELNAVALTVGQLRGNIALIQRDDGALANQTVTTDSLSAGVLALIAQGEYNPLGAWATTTVYAIGDVVTFNAATYLALVAHTAAATFATDLAANKWLLIANGALSGGATAVDLYEGTGSQTAFTLSYTYNGSNSATVFVGGVAQIPTQDFTISGTTITFVTAPPAPAIAGRKNVMVRGTGVEAQLAGNSATTAAANAANSATAAANSATAASTSATTATTQAANSSTSATLSSEWASNTTGQVAATDYSAKAWSIGGTGVTNSAGASKEWATKTGGTVDGTDYSAKYYSQASSTSATAAAGSASTATTQASAASASASAASTSASNASTSATNAQAYELSANNWATQLVTPVAGGEYSAKFHAQAASTSASAASTSASNAATSASNASTQATNASASATAAAASFDSFDDRYLGAKSSNPSVDNDGNALLTGALHFNTTASEMRVWNGTVWVAATVSPDTVQEVEFTATAGQTTYVFSGGYRVGFTYVWVNGVLLDDADLTATDGTNITFAAALTVGDKVRVMTFKAIGSVTVADITDLQTIINTQNSTIAAIPNPVAMALVFGS